MIARLYSLFFKPRSRDTWSLADRDEVGSLPRSVPPAFPRRVQTCSGQTYTVYDVEQENALAWADYDAIEARVEAEGR